MFCRSCWANLPDGTEQCPRCQHDPRVASDHPAADSPASPAPPPAHRTEPVPVIARPRPGRNLARLNAALAGTFVLIIAGPSLVRWWETWRASTTAAGTVPVVSEPPDALPEAVL